MLTIYYKLVLTGYVTESDTCLVVVTVFKIVAPTLVSGGRFDSYPLRHSVLQPALDLRFVALV